MLEGLTATHSGAFFHDEARRLGNPLRTGIRGSPFNHGPELETVHPVIRTNPVTGWKSVFVNKVFTKRINNVTRDESDWLLSYLHGVSTSFRPSLTIRPHLTIEYGSSSITITISKCGTLTRGTTWQFVGLGEADRKSVV